MSRGRTRSLNVFVSYAREDEELCNELRKHLDILENEGRIRTWHDRSMTPGDEWAAEIDQRLNAADLILLLVSPDYMASKYCRKVELPRALERHERGEARVVPILLRAVDWSHAPFARLGMLPKDARPVTSWPNLDEAFVNVQQGVRAAIERISRQGREDRGSSHGLGKPSGEGRSSRGVERPTEAARAAPRPEGGGTARPPFTEALARLGKPARAGITAAAVVLALAVVFAVSQDGSEPARGFIASRASYVNLTRPGRDALSGHDLRMKEDVDVFDVDGRSERVIGRWRKNTKVRVVKTFTGTAAGGLWLECQRID